VSLNFFPEWLHQLSFPPAVYEGSFFPTSWPTHVVGSVFDDGYSNRGEVESYCGFICISFMARDGEHFFIVFWPFEFLLLEKFCLYQLPVS
jgi:hypothetical protein